MRTDFPDAVTVLVGPGVPRRITGAGSALAFLEEQPASARDEAHEAAAAACREVLEGTCSVREACEVFTAYARRVAVLVEEPLTIPTETRSRVGI